jgi:hypothetical protein
MSTRPRLPVVLGLTVLAGFVGSAWVALCFLVGLLIHLDLLK